MRVKEAFYGMSKLIFVQKLSHFEVRDFGRISYKKMDKIEILRYFTPKVSAPLISDQMTIKYGIKSPNENW